MLAGKHLGQPTWRRQKNSRRWTAAGRKAREFGKVDAVVVLKYENPESELALNPVYCVTDTSDGGNGSRT